jgi:hypothetical protein
MSIDTLPPARVRSAVTLFFHMHQAIAWKYLQ